MTNIDTTDNLDIGGTETEKVTIYLGQIAAIENRTKQELLTRIEAGWSVFGQYRQICLDSYLFMSLKKRSSTNGSYQ